MRDLRILLEKNKNRIMFRPRTPPHSIIIFQGFERGGGVSSSTGHSEQYKTGDQIKL